MVVQPKSRSVIVTGGASGIGLAITEYFASQGNAIAVFDISSSASEVVSSLQTKFPSAKISFKKCDVSSWQQQAEVFAEVYRENGSIDVVMANAGISEPFKFIPTQVEDEPTEPNLKTININLVGTLYSLKLAIHYMRKNSSFDPTNRTKTNGLIICTASNAGLYPFPVAPVYGTSKHGVVGLVRSFSKPLESYGIQLNGLAPAVLETNIAPDKALFTKMILTPMSTLVKGVATFVENSSLTGEVAEIHGDKVTLSRHQEYVDEDSKTNLDTFWDLGYA